METNGSVTIPIQRYNKLLDIETRVDVAVERIMHGEYNKIVDILWILGTDLAVQEAMRLEEKAKKEHEEYIKKHPGLFGLE